MCLHRYALSTRKSLNPIIRDAVTARSRIRCFGVFDRLLSPDFYSWCQNMRTEAMTTSLDTRFMGETFLHKRLSLPEELIVHQCWAEGDLRDSIISHNEGQLMPPVAQPNACRGRHSKSKTPMRPLHHILDSPVCHPDNE